MELTIRNVECKDLDSIYPLFEQLWPNKSINRTELRKVFERGVDSATDELLCIVMGEEIIGFTAYALVNNLWQEGYISYIYAISKIVKSSGITIIGGTLNERLSRFYED